MGKGGFWARSLSRGGYVPRAGRIVPSNPSAIGGKIRIGLPTGVSRLSLDWSGRAMARSGLRMMPTFPSLPLKFRTAGFPRYGFKAGIADRAFPIDAPTRRSACLRPSCSPLSCLCPVLCRGTQRAGALPFEQHLPLYPRGPRSGPSYSVSVHPHLRPHPPHSQAHPDFAALRLIGDAFAVHTAPRRPPSGSKLSLSVLPDMPPSTTPGRSQPVGSSHAVST
jgi:hypothetical protein